MIPTFPQFKPIGIEDKDEIQAFTSCFPSYSDFNFVSLLCYDTQGDVIVSSLNGNLVLRLRDYLTQDVFYTFLGKGSLTESVETLLAYSQSERLAPTLRLVPEICITPEIADAFAVVPDDASADYLLSIERLTSLSIGKLKRKKQNIRSFKCKYPAYEIRRLDLTSSAMISQIENLCKLWQKKKDRSEEEFRTEFSAIRRCLAFARHLDLIGFGTFMNEQLAAFNIYEILPGNYCMLHFCKADPDFRSLADTSESETAQLMGRMNCSIINFEQDLGLPGLRQSKQSWVPVGFLKKYSITKKAASDVHEL